MRRLETEDRLGGARKKLCGGEEVAVNMATGRWLELSKPPNRIPGSEKVPLGGGGRGMNLSFPFSGIWETIRTL